VAITLLLTLFLSSCSRTSSSLEVVALIDGTSLLVKLFVTKGPGDLGYPGQGAVTGIELQFSRFGREFEWKRTLVRGEDWVSYPAIIDFVDGEPVVIFPVMRRWACAAYDYPQEGLVAERFKGERWQRVAIDSLPANLHANLAPNGFRGDPYGKDLRELVLFHRDYDESCAELHAEPDPVRDATTKLMAEAVASQPIVEPKAMPAAEITEEIHAELAASTVGKWKNGFIADSCSGLIDQIESFYVVNDPAHAAVEVRWVAKDGDRIRVRLRQSFTNVYCDNQSVIVLSQEWPPKATIAYRYGHDGSFRDAISFSTMTIRTDHPVGSIRAFAVTSDHLNLLWSESGACKQANDQDCWAYSVPLSR
jgi:hypothetical protein